MWKYLLNAGALSVPIHLSMKTVLSLCFFYLLTLGCFTVNAQLVETYYGHKRSGVDLLWFKYFKNSSGEQHPWLFFSRNRASIDHPESPALLGSTNAVSYNFKNGFGFVAVGSFQNSGFTPKAGIQYAFQHKDFSFFGWLVSDLKQQGQIDLFGLFRYQPIVYKTWRWMTQVELFPVYLPHRDFWNLTQRLRTGPKYGPWTAGFMADFNQAGNNSFTSIQNFGGFLRYEF